MITCWVHLTFIGGICQVIHYPISPQVCCTDVWLPTSAHHQHIDRRQRRTLRHHLQSITLGEPRRYRCCWNMIVISITQKSVSVICETAVGHLEPSYRIGVALHDHLWFSWWKLYQPTFRTQFVGVGVFRNWKLKSNAGCGRTPMWRAGSSSGMYPS